MTYIKFLITSFLFTSITLVSYGQSVEQTKPNSSSTQIPEFLGIRIGGKRDAVISAFKTKGFVVEGGIGKGNVVSMKGIVGDSQYELHIVNTPKSKLVWKISVYLQVEDSWDDLKDSYYKYLKILTNKYGNPEETFEFFSSPYKEGDGNEMIGVAAEKSHYSAFWNNEKGISINISKWKQVNISYQNQVNLKLANKEESELDTNIF